MKKSIAQWLCLLYSIVWLSLTAACSREPALPSVPEPLKLQKITSGEKNVHLYAYNEQGLLTAYHLDWSSPDNAQIRTVLDVSLAYDAQQRVNQLTYNGSQHVKFFYDGKLFDKTEEYDHKQRLAITHFYLFNADGQLVELLDQIHHADGDSTHSMSYIKYRYEYDGQPNVQRIHSFSRRAGDQSFKAFQTIVYANYDDKKNPHQPLIHYPFIAQACTQVNNPGKITVLNATDQSILSVETITYVYNEQGYPIRRTQQLTTTKPLPANITMYHY